MAKDALDGRHMEPSRPVIRTLFLLQRPEGWLNIRGVWRHMLQDTRFAPELWVLPYDIARPDHNAVSVAKWRVLLDDEAAGYREWAGSGAFDLGEFDVAVFTMPYDRERPPELHFDRVAERVKHAVYIPYGITMGAGRSNEQLQFAQPTQARASAVYVRSHHERALYRRYCPAGDRHVHVLGHPRFDSLFHLDGFRVDPALESAVNERYAVLWNSHFSFAPRFVGLWEYSTFDLIAGELLAYAANNPDVALIWRPHPRLLPTLVAEGLIRTTDIAAMKEELDRAGIILDERPDYRHAFSVSRALLTDLGSFLVEYLATGKPILYLHNPNGQGLNEEGRLLIRQLDVAQTAAEAIAFIEREMSSTASLPSSIASARREFLPFFDGRAAERVVEHIASVAGVGFEAVSRLSLGRFPILHGLARALATMSDRKAAARRRRTPLSMPGWRVIRQEIAQWVKVRPRLMRAVEGVKRLRNHDGIY